MNDTPKKTITITRKPTSTGTPTSSPAGVITRTGKRVIRIDPTAKPTHKPKPPTNKASNTKKKPPRKLATKKPVVAPSDLKARELNDRLNGFPVWLNFQPLAIGSDKDLFKLVNDECFPGASKKVVRKVLAMHAHHGRYLQAVTEGGARYRLDGTPEGEITDYQRQHVADTLATRNALATTA